MGGHGDAVVAWQPRIPALSIPPPAPGLVGAGGDAPPKMLRCGAVIVASSVLGAGRGLRAGVVRELYHRPPAFCLPAGSIDSLLVYIS